MNTTMKKYILLLVFALAIISCEEILEVDPPSQVSPDKVLSSQKGVEAVLYRSYRDATFGDGYHAEGTAPTEYPGDILFQTGGGMNRDFVLMNGFNWTAEASASNSAYWNPRYSSIRDANIVIANINSFEASEKVKRELLAEARFIRSMNYVYLYEAYGPVVLRQDPNDAPDLPRATEEEMKEFIVADLEAAAADLPVSGTEVFGRASNGAALGFLARYYMNIKDWENAAEAAKRVMEIGYYELFPSYRDLFKVENERDKNPANKEMIFVAACTNVNPFGNKISTCAQPPGFKTSEKLPEFVAEGIANWASQFRFYDSFIATFDKENDGRYDLILENYVNKGGRTVDLTATPNNQRTLKFFDNNADAASHGNDYPMLRYADILLMRAEALNEINGPNAESVNLINQVRQRAGLEELNAADFTKESLRSHILKERGWEFYYEGRRRADLIRHGEFVSRAQERGVSNAASHHRLYPIPQGELDANTNIEQNPGY